VDRPTRLLLHLVANRTGRRGELYTKAPIAEAISLIAIAWPYEHVDLENRKHRICKQTEFLHPTGR
jgi:hypothetical protein